MATHEMRFDVWQSILVAPRYSHNRWHPGITPVLRCRPGDELVFDTRDASDGQIARDATAADIPRIDGGRVHPLTGPVYVEGAQPGDLLIVDILEIRTIDFGYTVNLPGFGYLRDLYPEPFLAKWELREAGATSAAIPRVRVPAAPFLGVIGVAPSASTLARVTARERELAARGGLVMPPDPGSAVPADPALAGSGLRTMPARTFGGNYDVKQLTAGTRVLIPVEVPGALFSAGDAHFAQGSSECCGTAIETAATVHLRLDLDVGGAARRGVRSLAYQRRDGRAAPHALARGNYFATTGVCEHPDGSYAPESLNLSMRNAVRAMIEHLVTERGYTREQAYVICSVAVDVTIDGVSAAPTVAVSALLPEDIFV